MKTLLLLLISLAIASADPVVIPLTTIPKTHTPQTHNPETAKVKTDVPKHPIVLPPDPPMVAIARQENPSTSIPASGEEALRKHDELAALIGRPLHAYHGNGFYLWQLSLSNRFRNRGYSEDLRWEAQKYHDFVVQYQLN